MEIKKDLRNITRVSRELEYLQKHMVKIGILSKDKRTDDGANIYEYAVYNEFGTLYIPARPFFRYATQTRKARRIITNYTNRQISKVISTSGSYTGKQALNSIGLFVVGRIQDSIRNGDWQPNKRITKANKVPLIDEGNLIAAISWQIIKRT